MEFWFQELKVSFLFFLEQKANFCKPYINRITWVLSPNMHTKYLLKKILLVSLLIGTSPAGAGEVTSIPDSAIEMTAAEVKEMAAGNTASGGSSYGNFAIHFSNEGRLVIHKPKSGKSDTGKWYLNESGALCTKFDNWAKGKEKCRTFYMVDGEAWGFEPNGKVHKYEKIQEGNTTGKSL